MLLPLFDSLEAAEAAAQELSARHTENQVIVVTLHACFKTEVEYPRVVPITRTRRIEIPSKYAEVSPPADPA